MFGGFVASRTCSSSSISSLVDVKPAGRVDDDDVEPIAARLVEPVLGRCYRIARSVAIDGDLDLPAELLELLDRRRALKVAGDERRSLPFLAQEERELRRRRRLPRPLESGEEDHGRRSSESQPRVARAHERGELLVDDLHDLLARREALEHVLTERTLLDRRREALRDLQVDVGLEEREPHLAHRLRDRLLVEPAAAARGRRARLEPV